MIVEIVDGKEKIDELMPHIDEMVQEGLVTLERVQVIKYRERHKSGIRLKFHSVVIAATANAAY